MSSASVRPFGRILRFVFFAVALSALPALRAQPTIYLPGYSALTVELGQTASFTGFSAYGASPLTYQWVQVASDSSTTALVNGTTTNGSSIGGATSNWLRISGTTAADAGKYALQVTDANGTTATSTAITLTVKPAAAPTITAQPTNVTLIAGNDATFTYSASGSQPQTVQWYKGTAPGGTPVSGATTNPWILHAAAAGDAGSYYAVVTNSIGSATTNAATLTVNPATPVTFAYTPSPTTVYEGQYFYLWFSFSGSSPFTYQWNKDGSAIAGATNSTYSVTAATTAQSGNYTITVTNAAGAVTSPAVKVTVNPAIPVTFPSLSTSVTVNSGDYLWLSPSINGSGPMTYQWKKDGVAISGATNSYYNVSNVTTVAAGKYTLTVTSPAGTVTSPEITVKVNPPVAPTITSQPSAATVAQGVSASFSVYANGTNPMTYQWSKDGQPISGATSSYYSISAVQSSDAGNYAVTVTNVAGSTVSNNAKLTVLPPQLPTWNGLASSWPQSYQVGSSITLSVPYLSGGVGPFTYQWFRNGAAISGATGQSYAISNLTYADAGDYVVAVTNAAGTANAPIQTINVIAATSSSTGWIDAVRQGDVIYFLYAQHIERYDLAAGAWLPTTTTTQTATAICADTDGVFVAFGRALVKFPLDLSSQVTLANLGGSAGALWSAGGYIYAITGSSYMSTYPVDRTTGAVGAAQNVYVNTPASAVVSGSTLYTPNSIWGPQRYTIGTNGALTSTAFQYYTVFSSGNRAYLLPDGTHFADNSGAVFNVSDGLLSAGLGTAFTDMCFLSDGSPVVLRGQSLVQYAVGGGAERARASTAVAGSRLFRQGQNLLVFYPGTTSGNDYVAFDTVAVSSLTAPAAVAAIDPTSLSFTPDQVLQDSSGIVYLYDAARQNIYRWSPSTQAYLTSIPLRGTALRLAYSATQNRIFCLYRKGGITAISLDSSTPSEQAFSTSPLELTSLTGADGYLLALNTSQQMVFDSTGTMKSFRNSGYDSSYTWSSPSRTLFGSNGSVLKLGTDGVITNPTVWLNQSNTPPIFPAADGTRLIAASGHVFDGTGLYLGIIGNSVSDVVWLGSVPYTLRTSATGSEVQAWSPTNFVLNASANLTGRPLRLLPLGSNQLLVVTGTATAPSYTVLNTKLQRVSSTASAPTTGAPVFVTQPSASVTALTGSAVDLAVDVTGATPITFQWFKDGTAISGATTSVLHIASAASSDAANYTVKASNSAGDATTPATTLTVVTPVTFTTQPTNQTAAYGATATFTATVANGDTASYQWYFNNVAISGATSSTLVVMPVYSSNYGTYVLKVTNAAGSVYSNAVTLSAPAVPAPVITTQPQSTTVQAGGSLLLTVVATNATSYQWYLNGSAISGAIYSALSLNNITTANGGSYTVVVTGVGGTTTSQAAVITVQAIAGPVVGGWSWTTPVTVGSTATFSVTATNTTSYQWYHDGTIIPGETNATLSFVVSDASLAGAYTVVATGPGGSATGGPMDLVVKLSSYAGYYVGNLGNTGIWALYVDTNNKGQYIGYESDLGGVLADIVVNPDGSFSSTSVSWWAVASAKAVSGGIHIAAATAQATSVSGTISGTAVNGSVGGLNLSLSGGRNTGSSTSSVAGYYTASALNGAAGTTYLIVSPAGTIDGLIVNTASGVEFINGTVTASGQLSGMTSEGGTFAGTIDANTKVVTSTTTLPGNVTVQFGGSDSNHAPTAYLSNLSARAEVGTGANILVAGFAVSGSSKTILVRGVGPTLVNYKVTNALMTPRLTLFDGSQSQFWTGTAWGGDTNLRTLFDSLGAFPLSDSSADAATKTQTGSGGYTAQVSGVGDTTGVALAEVYDVSGSGTARLANLSARAHVGTGSAILVAGLVIGGTGPETVLLRGIGPTLTKYSVTGVLQKPHLALLQGDTVLAFNEGWGGAAAGDIITASNKVSAFPLDAGSGDAVLLVTLMPGTYTVQISGVGDTTGVALAEVYEVR